MGSGGDLLSRAVSSQVPSALKVLTSVFGMGTGGTPSPLPPEISQGFYTLTTAPEKDLLLCLADLLSLILALLSLKSNPRPISIIKLHALPHFHR